MQPVETARAKINLFLHVTGRRPDGYHTLQSLAVFADAGDVLRAQAAEELSLRVSGPFAFALEGERNNLVLKAAAALRDALGITRGAALQLEKRLPVAAGIGGGSADAAASLRLLARLWGKELPPGGMEALALKLGADVPMCLYSRSAVMSGIGEVMQPFALPAPVPLLLVNAGAPVLTADVFRALPKCNWPAEMQIPAFSGKDAFVRWLKEETRNDLQDAALACEGTIAEVLAALEAQPACRLARMSGSGGTCFGIFDTAREAQLAAEGLRGHYGDWWIMPCEGGA